MRQALRYSAALLIAMIASYVIAVHGFNAVAKQVTDQSQFQQVAGGLAFFRGAAAVPVGF